LFLAAEDLILRSEGYSVNKVFDLSERAKRSRENKTKFHAQNFKPANAQQRARLEWSEHNRIAIECAP